MPRLHNNLPQTEQNDGYGRRRRPSELLIEYRNFCGSSPADEIKDVVILS